MTRMEYRIILEPDPENGGYVSRCPALPGIPGDVLARKQFEELLK